MAILDDTKPRLILPRWRNLNSSISSKLILSSEKIDSRDSIQNDFFKQSKIDFEKEKSFANALEVINAGFSLSEEQNIIEEARFIRALNKTLPSSLSNIVNKILDSGESIIVEDVTGIKNAHLKNIFQEAGKNITLIRGRLKKFSFNPLLWLELSRLYAILGHIKKAEAASLMALKLSKNSNRLITRSVSRFYVHKKDFAQAQNIVRKSIGFQKDPWLIAADISYSQFLHRVPTSRKVGMEIIENKNFSDADITELAAALGTEEFLNNSRKASEKFFYQSLKDPNENSFAQVEFFLDDFDNKQNLIKNISNNFEAQSWELRKLKKYDKSFEKSSQWLIDQPFSRRAAYFNSFLLCGILENFEKAIEYGKFSLISNPDSFLLVNNITYSYCQLGDVKNAKLFFKRLKKITNISLDQEVIILATEGLLRYKELKIDEGRELYRKAILKAEKQKNKLLRAQALLHFAREEYASNSLDKAEVFSIITNLEKEGIDKEDIEIELQSLNKILFKKTKQN